MNDDEAREQLTGLWLDHKNAVESFVRRRCLDGSVDDIVQEVFMIAWRKLEEVPSEPRPWLLTVARHVISNRSRSDRRHDGLALRLGAFPDDGTSSAEDRGIERVSLRRGWAGLTDQERETLSLVAWDQLTGAEAARVLGITRGAFAVRLMRARRHLSRLVGDDLGEDRTVTTRSSAATASTRTDSPPATGHLSLVADRPARVADHSARTSKRIIPPARPLALAGVECERTVK